MAPYLFANKNAFLTKECSPIFRLGSDWFPIHLRWGAFLGMWLGWAMVLGSFQCRGVLLLLHIVEQGPAMLASGVGTHGLYFYIFHLSSLSNVLSLGRRLNMTEILWFRLLNPNG